MNNKPSVVWVPGLMCDRTVWAPIWPAFEPFFVNSVADHGQAGSLVRMAEQILEAAPTRFALVGHSMGGRVALEICRLAPERVSRLVLMCTGCLPLPPDQAGQAEVDKRMRLVVLARSQGVRAMALEWVKGMVRPDRLDDQALIETIVAMMARQSAQIFENQISALIGRRDSSPVLTGLRIPCQIVCARFDSWASVAQHEHMASLLPGNTPVEVVPDAGHMMSLENPGATIKLLLPFLLQALNRGPNDAFNQPAPCTPP